VTSPRRSSEPGGVESRIDGTGGRPSAGKAVVRHDKILAVLAQGGEVSARELAQQFTVSLITIRRDLMLLERQGKLRRTHGGAILSPTRVVEFSFFERGRMRAEEKALIAREAAKLVRPGMAISLDGGTTTFEVAMVIREISPLTVLTPSLAIAAVLYAQANIELVLVGGMAGSNSPDLTGTLTEQNLKQFHVDLAFVGCDGIDHDGAYAKTVAVIRVCRAIVDGSDKIVLVADHSKFAKPSFSRFATLQEFDRIITDDRVPDATRQWLSDQSLPVTYATP
jgi:DeoR/GlpR family transcriptional regulator of sugar metabolism